MVYLVIYSMILLLFKYEPKVLSKDYTYKFRMFGKKEIKCTIGNREVLFLFSFLLLFLIAALRENVGTDYAIYRDYHIPKVLEGNYTHIEPFSTVLFILGDLLGSYQMIFILIHILIIGFTLKAIYDQSSNYLLSFFLFFSVGFFNTSLNLMRQAIAIAIFLYAIKYIEKRKVFHYYSWIIVAILFHKTALIYLPIYFLNRIKFSFKEIFTLILSFVLISGFFDNILNFLTLKLDIYRNYWGHTEMSSRVGHNFSLTHWSVNITVFIVMIILFYLGRKKTSEEIEKLSVFIHIQLLSLFVMYAAYVTYVPNFDRILIMFSYAQIITLPSFFSLDVDKKVKKILLFLTAIVLLVGFLMLIILKNIGQTFPYTTIFN